MGDEEGEKEMTDKEKELFKVFVYIQASILGHGTSKNKEKRIKAVLVKLGFTDDEIAEGRLYFV